MKTLCLLFISSLLLSMGTIQAAQTLVNEEFINPAILVVKGTGVRFSSGMVHFASDGYSYVEIPASSTDVVSAMDLKIRIRFNNLDDSKRFLYKRNSFHIHKARKDIVIYLLVSGQYQTYYLRGVINSITAIQEYQFKIENGELIGLVDGVEKGRFTLPGDFFLSTTPLYVGGTPWDINANASLDSLFLNLGQASFGPNDRFVSPSGNDSSDGSLNAPFKTIDYAVKQLTPGQTLYVRQGKYRESVGLKNNGTMDKPITITNYPGEVAVLDGGLSLASLGLKKLTAQEPALLNNPNWSKLYKVSFPAALIPAAPVELISNDRFMKLAQYPNRPHDVFMKGKDFATLTEGQDSTAFIQNDYIDGKPTNYWNGQVMSNGQVIADYKTQVAHWSHAGNNEIYYYPIIRSSYDKLVPATALLHPVKLSPNADGFSIINHPAVLDEPGEFAWYKDATDTIHLYVWPYDTQVSGISVISQLSAFRGAPAVWGTPISYVTMKGLQIKNYGAKDKSQAGGVNFSTGVVSESIRLQDLRISNIVGTGIAMSGAKNLRVEGCTISKVKFQRGISVAKNQNARIIGNSVEETERTGIYTSESLNTAIVANTVGKQGLHGNGISSYQNDVGALIYRNKIDTENIGITIQASSDFTILSNLVISNQNKVMASWSHNSGYIRILNNIFYTTLPNSLAVSRGAVDNFSEEIIANNIHSGGLWTGYGLKLHNIYTAFAWNEQARYGFSLGTGEFLESNLAVLFKDMQNKDYSPAIAGKSINAGTDVSMYLNQSRYPDIDLNLSLEGKRRNPASVDIGPYEMP